MSAGGGIAAEVVDSAEAVSLSSAPVLPGPSSGSCVPYPENSLAERFLRNDPEVVGQVMRWISAALTAPRFWMLRQEWPDLMQEILLRAIKSLRSGHFDPSRDLRVYVQGICRIVCLEAVADQAESTKHEHHGDGPGAAAATAAPEPLIDRQMARRVLDLASEECRELFRLYYLEGKDYQEIAAVAGLPVGTVKSRLFRCLESAFVALSPPGGRFRSRHPKPGKSI